MRLSISYFCAHLSFGCVVSTGRCHAITLTDHSRDFYLWTNNILAYLPTPSAAWCDLHLRLSLDLSLR